MRRMRPSPAPKAKPRSEIRTLRPDRRSFRSGSQIRRRSSPRPRLSHAHDRTGARRRPSSCRAHLKRVQPAAAEGEAEDLLDPGGANLERSAPGEFVDVLIARAVGRVEDPEVRDEQRRAAPIPRSARHEIAVIVVATALLARWARAVGTTCPTLAEMSITRLIAPSRVTRSSSPWLESIGYSAPPAAIMLYHVPSGSKSSSSGLATGCAPERAEVRDHRPPPSRRTRTTPLGRPGPRASTRRRPTARTADGHERHAGNAADQAADGWTGLARGQRPSPPSSPPRRAHLRDPPAPHRVVRAPGIGSGRHRSPADTCRPSSSSRPGRPSATYRFPSGPKVRPRDC